MSRYFRFVRFAIVWLVILMIGRFVLGAMEVPYSEGTWLFSMVLFSNFAALIFAGFSRRVMGANLLQGMLVGASVALSAQVLILLATLGSYLVGAETYFNNPTALNVEEAVGVGRALGIRLFGLVVNTILCSIVGLIGWSMGGLIPEKA